MSEAGTRTLTTESSSSIPHRRDRIDLTITVNLSRLAPPDINLMAFSHDHGKASLTEYPLKHLMQSRDLDLEVDEIKKAVQHEVWSLFQVWHPRSTFHLTVEVRTPEHSRSIAQQLAYDTTIDEVLQLLPPRRSCLHFIVMPNDLDPASSSGPSQSAHGPTGNTMPWNTAEGAPGETSRNKMPTPGNDGRMISNDARSSRSPLRDHNVVTRTCCPLAPHCDKFAKKYGRKDEKKQLEYRYLFAAHHHCLRCMQYYCDQEDVNPHCKSENKNARDWAELYNKIIPRALEVWLANRGL